MQKVPRVGVGVLIVNGDLVLMGKRKNAHGNGAWSPPGGHLEFGESLEACARREVLEETGLQVGDIRQGPVTNDIFVAEDKHYLTVLMIAEYAGGTPETLEPEKCAGWQWFSLDNLPQPLFLPMQNLIEGNPQCLNFFLQKQ